MHGYRAVDFKRSDSFFHFKRTIHSSIVCPAVLSSSSPFTQFILELSLPASYSAVCSARMPTALGRTLQAFKLQLLSSSQAYKGALHHVGTLRSVWCQQLATPEVEQQSRAAKGKGLCLVWCSSSPPPSVKKAREAWHRRSFYCCEFKVLLLPTASNCLFRLEKNRILSSDYLTLSTMEAEIRKKTSIEKSEEEQGVDAQEEAEEKERLQKQKEKEDKERKEEEERQRAKKEQEMEEKIGPPPEKPLAGDCCGQGCEVCIWDTYWEELDEYKKLRKAAEESEE